MAMKQPNVRTLAVLAISRIFIGLGALLGVIIVAAIAGAAVRVFILAAGL